MLWLPLSVGDLETQITEGNNWIGKLSFGVKAVANPATFFSKMQEEVRNATSLSRALDCLKRFVLDNPRTVPVIIIDEAHSLKTWQPSFHNELTTVLEFLSWLTKQKQAAHVVLTSSDDLFRDWLHVNGKLLYRCFGLGNFGKPDAEVFFRERCLDSEQNSTVDRWEDLFRYTGGSPSMLFMAAELGTEMSWPEERLLEEAVPGLVTRLSESSTEYNRADAAKVIDELIAKDGVVPVDNMIDKLAQAEADELACAAPNDPPAQPDKYKARMKLRGMLKGNIFHMRYCPRGMSYEDMKRSADCPSWDFLMPFRPVDLEAAGHALF